MSKTHKISILAGDGIGPEVMDVALEVLEATAAKFDFQISHSNHLVGGAALDALGLGGEVADVGARVRLRHGQGADVLTTAELWQVLLLLCLVAILAQLVQAQVGHGTVGQAH